LLYGLFEMHVYWLGFRVLDDVKLVELGLRLGECGFVGDRPGVR